MDTTSRNQEITAVFAAPWAYPGLSTRLATSCCLGFEERHHLTWSSWTIFNDGQQAYARRIEWPRMLGTDSQTGEFSRTFASESMIDRELADALITEAMAAATLETPRDADACAIDGAEKSLRFWHDGVPKSLNWQSSAGGSPLDAWFARAAEFLDKRLPESSAQACYEIRLDEMPSKAASDPRQP